MVPRAESSLVLGNFEKFSIATIRDLNSSSGKAFPLLCENHPNGPLVIVSEASLHLTQCFWGKLRHRN